MVVGKDLIIDGRHRWRSAKRLQIAEVPTVQRTEAETHGIILNSLLQRRHFTKSAMAYLTFPLMADAYAEAQQRKLDCLKKGSRSAGSALRANSIEELADLVGVGRRLFFQAKELHEKFSEDPELRSQFEQDILSGEVGLGATIAGIAGQKATKSKSKPKEDQLELFDDGLVTIEKRFRYWEKFNPDQRDHAAKAIRRAVAKMPEELRREFARAIRAADKDDQE